MFTIGEFSRITGFAVTALRFYHDEGVRPSKCLDGHKGYRYSAKSKVEFAQAIVERRRYEFSAQRNRPRCCSSPDRRPWSIP